LGEELARLPAHTRLGRLLVAGANRGVLRETAVAAALLSERDPFRSANHAARGPRDYGAVRSRSDVVDRVLALQAFRAGGASLDSEFALHPGGARNVLRTADQLFHLAEFPRAPRADDPSEALMQCLLEAFPDRLAKLRPGGHDRALMVGGRGVRIDRASRVRGEPLFLAIEVNDAGGEARARLVSAVDRAWLSPEILQSRDELFFNPSRGHVEARSRTYWDDLLIEETPVPIADADAEAAAALLANEARQNLERFLPAGDAPAGRFLARARWLSAVMPELGLPAFDAVALNAVLSERCRGLRSLEELRMADWLPSLHAAVGYDRLGEIDRLAPDSIEAPSGNRHCIVYESGKAPTLAVRIQELYGWRETPRIAEGRVPLVMELLGPNYRPQQVTSDLASFWQNTYPEVRKELKRRYPKPAWPNDPAAAEASRSGLQRDAK
jgi:ATP-dependent helicase HrpB